MDVRILPTGLVLGCDWCPFLVGCSAKLSLGGASPSQVSCWLAGWFFGRSPSTGNVCFWVVTALGPLQEGNLQESQLQSQYSPL